FQGGRQKRASPFCGFCFPGSACFIRLICLEQGLADGGGGSHLRVQGQIVVAAGAARQGQRADGTASADQSPAVLDTQDIIGLLQKRSAPAAVGVVGAAGQDPLRKVSVFLRRAAPGGRKA